MYRMKKLILDLALSFDAWCICMYWWLDLGGKEERKMMVVNKSRKQRIGPGFGFRESR